MRVSAALFVALCCFAETSSRAEDAKPAAQSSVSFTKDIAPLLVKHCQACHGKSEPMGEYQVNTYELAMKEGIVTSGKPDESDLVYRLTESDPDVRMPQDADPLAPEQIDLFRRWIADGAKFDNADPKAELVSIVPKLAHPDAPAAYRVPIPITAVALSADGKELAVGGYHEITIWNPADGALLRRIKNVAQRTYGLAYSPDGKLLAAASGTPAQLGEVKMFSPADGTLVKDLGTMSDVAFDVAFNPAGDKLAACAADRSIRIYDVASGKEERLIEDHADWVMAIAWSPDGSQLASAGRDKTSKLFEVNSGDSLATYPGHGDSVFGVSFTADGKQVLSAGADRKIHLWNPADGKKSADIAGFGLDVYQILLEDGQIFTCSADKTARQFAADTRQAVRTYSGHADWVYTLSYNKATQRLATGSYDGEVRVWSTEDGKLVTAFKAAPGYAPANVQASAATAR